MEYLVESKQNQKSIERFVLILYSLYSAYLCLDCVRQEWNTGIPVFIFGLVAAAWVLHILEWKQYRTRVLWIVLIMQFTVALYACNAQDMSVTILSLIAMAVLVAFFEERGAVGIVAVSTVMIFAYHGLIKETFSALSASELDNLLFQTGNLIGVECIVYVWVKRRSAITEYMSRIMEDLQEAEHSQDDFLANISHEIRTPINTICGMSEIALREKNLDKIREELIGIQDAGHNLTALVNDILDFSQLQSGKMELEEENYNITSTINDIIAMTTVKIQEKKLELIVDCDGDIPQTLFGDEKKIRRVILNLVNNAVKFTSEGCVGIHISCRQESYGVNLMVTVTDTGIGIREENIEKLFLSFSQMDTRRNRQEGGVGLGLAISKALVKQMGGNIAVDSTYGKGSAFRFVVPQKVVDQRPITEVDSRKILHTERLTAPDAHVLVVDDNLMNIRVMEGLLKEYKIKVSKAQSGREALDVVESMEFDLIFMDHMMPEMDGIETFHRIREKEGSYFKEVPVVALTANVAPGMRETFMEEGFADFISKPVEISVLERMLNRILPKEKIHILKEEVISCDAQEAETEVTSGESNMGLDMEKGMLYCGGEESYFDILSICCRDYASNVEELNALLQAKDWKNYTIKIHALKSNMNSVGAFPLGELARELEMAGKREDGGFIQERHESVMEKYQQLIERIKKHPKVVCTEEPPERETMEAEVEENLPELADAAFDEILSSMEEAMFEQDGAELLRLLCTLQTYQYHQTPLAAELTGVQRKIEMEDYMSAVDMLADIRKKLAEKGGH